LQRRLTVVLLLLAASSTAIQARTLYVCRGDCDGLDPVFDTIQDAVDQAEYGDTVLVSPGVYEDGHDSVTWPGALGTVVDLFSGIHLVSAEGPENTEIVLSTNLANDACITLPTGTEGASISGFTLTSKPGTNNRCVFIPTGIVGNTITECVLRGASSSQAICLNAYSSATIQNNTFAGNCVGIYANLPADGLDISRNIISGCSSDGVKRYDGSPPVIRENDFWDNSGDNIDGFTPPPEDGNLFDVDPMFCDLDAGSYNISVDSPCYSDTLRAQWIGARLPPCGGSADAKDRDDLLRTLTNQVRVFASPSLLHSGQVARVRVQGAPGSGDLILITVTGRELFRTRVSVSDGPMVFSWNGRDQMGHAVEAGVYFWAFEARGMRSSQRILVVR
jgi:hypothetical protein